MPVANSSYGFIIQDPKPERVCNYARCPNKASYRGLKLKQYARCHWIRYCSKKCQTKDWPLHRAVCQPQKVVDIGTWMEDNRPLFHWAAREALGRGGANRTAECALVLDVVRTDRLVAPTAAPFLVRRCGVLAHDRAAVAAGVPGVSFYGAADAAGSARIRARGGLGVALVLFIIEGPNGTQMFQFMRLDIEEPVSDAPPALGWQATLKRIANHGEGEPGELARMLEGPGQAN